MNYTKRIKSFLWRTSAFVSVAIFSYLANVSDIREIDANKLLTLSLAGISSLILAEITKYLNSQNNL